MKAGRYIRTMPEEDQAKLFDLLVEYGMLDDHFHTTELGEQYIASGEPPTPVIEFAPRESDASLKVTITEPTTRATVEQLETMCQSLAADLAAKGIWLSYSIDYPAIEEG